MEKFCQDYNITLGHSTTYYPQGNGLAESSNKSLTRIIKRLLQDNKKAWHKNYIMRCGQIRLPPRSPSQRHLSRLYMAQTQFSLPHWGFPSESCCKSRRSSQMTQRRINQLIHTQQMREQVYNRSQLHQERMKKTFDKHSKQRISGWGIWC
jgi:hypothetical protein